MIAARREKTDRTADLRVQGFVATVRGGFSDLAWSAPEFDPAIRQLVGFELFRDDTSTEPPSRLTWRTMPPQVVEARGLEIVPHGEYGVQPIWRRTTDAEPVAAIEYGPTRLTKDLAGPAIVEGVEAATEETAAPATETTEEPAAVEAPAPSAELDERLPAARGAAVTRRE